MEKEGQKKEIKRYLIISILLVVSIATIGISLSYAYFTLNFINPTEGETIPNNTAANLNVTSTIDDENTKAINTQNLALIEEDEVEEHAEHVQFTVTNHGPSAEEQNASNINAKYTISIVDMSLSKNLFSKYFKWKIVIKPGDGDQEQTEITGTFADERCQTSTGEEVQTDCIKEGTTLSGWSGGLTTPTDADIEKNMTKQLLTEGQSLKIGETDTIDFYIWLENDQKVDQLYLTNGSFSGKLSVSAVPDKAS